MCPVTACGPPEHMHGPQVVELPAHAGPPPRPPIVVATTPPDFAVSFVFEKRRPPTGFRIRPVSCATRASCCSQCNSDSDVGRSTFSSAELTRSLSLFRLSSSSVLLLRRNVAILAPGRGLVAPPTPKNSCAFAWCFFFLFLFWWAAQLPHPHVPSSCGSRRGGAR